MTGAPVEDIEGCRAAHAALLAAVSTLTDAQAREASRLPGWTVGHVLTHLARNADSVVRHLKGAARGEVVDQYPGGLEARAAAIEEGAGRPVGVLVDDVAVASARAERAFATMPEQAWDNLVRGSRGNVYPARFVAFTRWREVEVHHVDLGLGRTFDDVPAALVDRWLPTELARLGERVAPARLLAWVLGREPAPDLGPW